MCDFIGELFSLIFRDPSNWVIAVATVANVLVTATYVLITRGLWQQTKKSADAATTSANAAQESVRLMRQQLDEQAGLGRSMVKTAVASAISATTSWRAQNIANLATTRSLPPTDDLVPADGRAVLYHAARIDPEAAELISSAFDDMGQARSKIESIRHAETNVGRVAGLYDLARAETERYLDSANEKLGQVWLRFV
jgi:hypothetical protein